MTPLEDEAQESEPGETLPVPRFRVDRDVDLDGLALAEGGVTADALKKLAQGKNDVGEDPRSAKIRIVGPAFFPVQ